METQETISAWGRKTFGEPDALAIGARMNCEVAELLVALRAAWAARDRLPELGDEAHRAAADWTWAASARKLHQALADGLRRHTPAATTVAPSARRADR